MREMAIEMVQELYGYHWWANRRLWAATSGLGSRGEGAVGKQFSFPTLKATFAHIVAADAIWLARCKGGAPTRLLGDSDFPTLDALRARWDELESEQRAYIGALVAADLRRSIGYRNTAGQPFALPLWVILEHVANHATHHRSEIATMLTMISGSPPDTGVVTYHLAKSRHTS